MKTFMIRSFIGISFGGFIAVLITNLNVVIGGFEMIDGSLFLKNSVGSILCGWFYTVSPMYFENRNLKLHQQTILHFLTVTILYLILALTIRWIPFNIISILLTLLIATVVYTIIWIAFYLYFKYQARKLNDDLNKL
jgi:NhaP-type Na+/H+ or K+/H+ antiporter